MSDMCKHPLLPDMYLDKNIQSAILSAFKPYKLNDRRDISNPKLKWDLVRAWRDAETLLTQGIWKYKKFEDFGGMGYELSADAEKEVEDLNKVIAGIVAYQIMEPESGVAVYRIEHKSGGQMVLSISGKAAAKLNEVLPDFMSAQAPETVSKPWWERLGLIRSKKAS